MHYMAPLNIWREYKGIAIQINKKELDIVKIYE